MSTTFDSSYDAVVVGSGLGGLAAALRLAVASKRVLLLEQHNLPGGFATSFVRGRFEFEASLHELADVGPEGPNKGPIRYFFQDEAGVDVEFVPIPEAYRVILTDEAHKIDVELPYGVPEYIDAVCEAVPETPRENLIKYLDLCKQIYEAISFIGSRGKIDYQVLMSKYKSFLTTYGYTVDEVTHKFGFPQKTLDILYPYWCYLGIPTSRLNFSIWGTMLYSFLLRGAWIPRGTSHSMVTAIDMRIRELGGQTEYNTRVKHILIEDEKVTGIETENGDKIKTSYVVANCSPHLVYGQMIYPKNSVPDKARKYYSFRKLGGAGFVVYLGLDASPSELNLDSYNFFVCPHMDTEKIYNSFRQVDKAPIFSAGLCPNNLIPDYSPSGTSIFSITTLFDPDAWKNITPEKYVSQKNKIAADLIEQVSAALNSPLMDHIEEIEVATPQTYSRYTGNLKGVIYGYEQDPWDGFVIRSQNQQKEQFFKGLEFAGGYAAMGHGYSVSLLSGRQAALNIITQMRKEGN